MVAGRKANLCWLVWGVRGDEMMMTGEGEGGGEGDEKKKKEKKEKKEKEGKIYHEILLKISWSRRKAEIEILQCCSCCCCRGNFGLGLRLLLLLQWWRWYCHLLRRSSIQRRKLLFPLPLFMRVSSSSNSRMRCIFFCICARRKIWRMRLQARTM